LVVICAGVYEPPASVMLVTPARCLVTPPAQRLREGDHRALASTLGCHD
jgi:hypothetical protein